MKKNIIVIIFTILIIASCLFLYFNFSNKKEDKQKTEEISEKDNSNKAVLLLVDRTGYSEKNFKIISSDTKKEIYTIKYSKNSENIEYIVYLKEKRYEMNSKNGSTAN